MQPEAPDERLIIETICSQIDTALEASPATPGLKTVAAIIVAARHARNASMPSFVASAMLARYILQDPLPRH